MFISDYQKLNEKELKEIIDNCQFELKRRKLLNFAHTMTSFFEWIERPLTNKKRRRGAFPV